ncbi:hypothetical protein GLYMA_01G067300v4 [Glycine max]|uniref:DNA-directed RNA polymerase n=2 Tax=Glycine subgen. Soja TaxID=1462606 RepID=A0A0R0LES0_SOYBN|nr:hypothetical protein GYH30_000711 [Glycine max]KAH1161952.1 hypothetical protein GYH30_000711 [Glycine max]KRH75173.1 hypothetical protein GLYMA_01G067300v4 [Glycine max]KRH75174.1 hypothetical protein GLYMA_01G067300v4 [Glycine max]RZC28815.1 DNA-directed RNA polymerase II subunit 1 [Glycine soja]
MPYMNCHCPMMMKGLNLWEIDRKRLDSWEAARNNCGSSKGNIQDGACDIGELVEKSHGGCRMKINAKYKAQKKKSDDQEQLPEPIKRKQTLSTERLLGFNPKYAHPDRMILQVLPIPPQIARPSIMMDTSSRSEDDITHQLAMIIRHNENLKRQEKNGSPAHIISEFVQLLLFQVAKYFDNEFKWFIAFEI